MAKRKIGAAAKSCKAPAKTKKFNKKNYTRSTTTMNKTAAKKRRDNVKSKGGRARVIKNPCGAGFYVYSRKTK